MCGADRNRGIKETLRPLHLCETPPQLPGPSRWSHSKTDLSQNASSGLLAYSLAVQIGALESLANLPMLLAWVKLTAEGMSIFLGQLS